MKQILHVHVSAEQFGIGAWIMIGVNEFILVSRGHYGVLVDSGKHSQQDWD